MHGERRYFIAFCLIHPEMIVMVVMVGMVGMVVVLVLVFLVVARVLAQQMTLRWTAIVSSHLMLLFVRYSVTNGRE